MESYSPGHYLSLEDRLGKRENWPRGHGIESQSGFDSLTARIFVFADGHTGGLKVRSQACTSTRALPARIKPPPRISRALIRSCPQAMEMTEAKTGSSK